MADDFDRYGWLGEELRKKLGEMPPPRFEFVLGDPVEAQLKTAAEATEYCPVCGAKRRRSKTYEAALEREFLRGTRGIARDYRCGMQLFVFENPFGPGEVQAIKVNACQDASNNAMRWVNRVVRRRG